MNNICLQCGAPIPERRSKYHAKFCSHQCQIAYNKLRALKKNMEKHATLQCVACGKTLPKGQKAFCSLACRKAYHKRPRPDLVKLCPICHEPFTAHRADAIYCGDDCRRESMLIRYHQEHGTPYVPPEERRKRKCPCGQPVPKGRIKFCSDKCLKAEHLRQHDTRKRR